MVPSDHLTAPAAPSGQGYFQFSDDFVQCLVARRQLGQLLQSPDLSTRSTLCRLDHLLILHSTLVERQSAEASSRTEQFPSTPGGRSPPYGGAHGHGSRTADFDATSR